jgi:hypothetical protein
MTPPIHNTPRAGDEVIAIDREVAVALAEAGHQTWSPNATLRYLLDLPQQSNRRRSDWRRRVLAQYQK